MISVPLKQTPILGGYRGHLCGSSQEVYNPTEFVQSGPSGSTQGPSWPGTDISKSASSPLMPQEVLSYKRTTFSPLISPLFHSSQLCSLPSPHLLMLSLSMKVPYQGAESLCVHPLLRYICCLGLKDAPHPPKEAQGRGAPGKERRETPARGFLQE